MKFIKNKKLITVLLSQIRKNEIMLLRSEHYVAYMYAEELGYEGDCACSQKTTMVRIDML